MLSSSVKADALKVIQLDGLWTIKKQNKQIFHNNDLTELAKAPADTAQNEPWEAPRAPPGATCTVSKHRALTCGYVTAYTL